MCLSIRPSSVIARLIQTCFAVFGLLVAAGTARAEDATSKPIQFYGLGTLTFTTWSPDGLMLATGGSAGAFLWSDEESRVTRLLIGHEDTLTDAAFSADGMLVVTGSLDWDARLWSVLDGTTIRVLSGHDGAVRSVAFSPDGTKVLTGSDDDTAILWNAADGSEVTTFSGHAGPVVSVVYSPLITRVLTASRDGTAKLWNAATGAVIRTFDGGSSVAGVALSDDGTKILTGGGSSTRLHDAGDGRLLWERVYGPHMAEIASVAYSSADQVVATGATDGWVVLRRADDGTTLHVLLAGDGPIESISFAPWGDAFITAIGAPENTPKFWYVGGLPNDVVISGHTDAVHSATFSPNWSEVLTGSADGTARIWNVWDGGLVRTLSGHTGQVMSAVFSPDGEYALTGASAPDNTARIWNLLDGSVLETLSGHTGSVNSVAFSPDGTQALTGSSDTTARLWNVSDGTVVRTFSGHTGEVQAVALSPDGMKVLTGSSDGTARIWNASDGTAITTFSLPGRSVGAVAFSPDGRAILTGSSEGMARIWNAADATVIRTFPKHTDSIHSVAFSPDGRRILTGGSDGTAQLRSAMDGTLVRTLFGHTDSVYSVAFSCDGSRMLTASADRTARLWPPDASYLEGHMPALTAVAIAAERTTTVITCHENNRVWLWDGAVGKPVTSFYEHVARVNGAALSPDGLYLLTASNDRTARLWAVEGEYTIHTVTEHYAPVNAVAFSSDAASYVTAGNDGWALLWDTQDGSPLGSFAHGDEVYAVAFSRDGTRLLTGGADHAAQLWNVATGVRLHTLTGHAGDVLSVAFSRDGTRVATGSGDGTAKTWNPGNGSLVRTFPGHTAPVVSVAFSPDASSILTASEQTLYVWDAGDGSLLRTLRSHTDWITGAALSGDGTRVLTGSEDGTARLWPAFAGQGAGGLIATDDKFILVAGGGNYVGNPIVDQTQALADRVYFTCLVRGYRPNEIRYLSAFNDWQTRDSNDDGLPDADDYASTQAFWSAIDSWSSDTARLFIYLLDHGSYNPQSDEYFFHLNPDGSIKAGDLDVHLDAHQQQTGAEVILIVDACFSGGFVRRCTATTGTRRVVISATTPDDLAVYTPPEGAESFSFYFLSYALLGNTLEDCYRWTKLSFATLGNPAGQDPWLDDSGDGLPGKEDGAVAREHVLGRYPAFGLNAPRITDVAPAATVGVDEPVALWAQLDERVAAGAVWAVVVPRSMAYSAGDPVTNLTRVDLASTPGTPNLWQTTWTPGAAYLGFCDVTYFATSRDTLQARLVATPVASRLHVTGTAVTIPWQLLP